MKTYLPQAAQRKFQFKLWKGDFATNSGKERQQVNQFSPVTCHLQFPCRVWVSRDVVDSDIKFSLSFIFFFKYERI